MCKWKSHSPLQRTYILVFSFLIFQFGPHELVKEHIFLFVLRDSYLISWDTNSGSALPQIHIFIEICLENFVCLTACLASALLCLYVVYIVLEECRNDCIALFNTVLD